MGVKFNPFTGTFDFTGTGATAGATPDNFSYKKIATANTVTIPDNQQMIVASASIEISGELVLDGEGELFLLEAF